jgi:hypothetical protein
MLLHENQGVNAHVIASMVSSNHLQCTQVYTDASSMQGRQLCWCASTEQSAQKQQLLTIAVQVDLLAHECCLDTKARLGCNGEAAVRARPGCSTSTGDGQHTASVILLLVIKSVL